LPEQLLLKKLKKFSFHLRSNLLNQSNSNIICITIKKLKMPDGRGRSGGFWSWSGRRMYMLKLRA